MNWKYVRTIRIPTGRGQGYLLESEDGLELVVPWHHRWLQSGREAADWANLYVRLLDDLPTEL